MGQNFIKIIQICGDPIALPLILGFETALKDKKIPDMWKKANVVPVHTKEENNLLKNHRLITLLLFLAKYLKDNL